MKFSRRVRGQAERFLVQINGCACLALAAFGTIFIGTGTQATGQDYLYWSQSIRNTTPYVTDVFVRRSVVGGRQSVFNQLEPASVFLGIAFDSVGAHVFASDSSGIYRANLDGSGKIKISSPGTAATDLEIDPVHGKLYYALISGSSNQVRAMNFDGTGDAAVMTVPGDVQGIALNVGAGKLYASTDNPAAPIREANLDGSGQIAFRNLTRSVGAFDVEVDSVGGRLFWTDNNSGDGVFSAALDGSGTVNTVLSGAGVGANGLNFDPVDRKLYVFSLGTSSILRSNPDGSGLETFMTNTPNLAYLQAVHVPEPSGFMLLSLGAFGLVRRRGTRLPKKASIAE